jgi:hypothetical protein
VRSQLLNRCGPGKGCKGGVKGGERGEEGEGNGRKDLGNVSSPSPSLLLLLFPSLPLLPMARRMTRSRPL